MDGNGACSDHSRRLLDYVTVSIIAIAVIPFILANIVLLLNRSFLPIKTTSVDVTLHGSVGGLIWIVSTIVVFDHLGHPRGLLSACSLWTSWLQLCFGFGLWLNSFIVRLINLYRIFILGKSGFSYPTFPLLLLLSPLIIFCILATALNASRLRKRPEEVDDWECTVIMPFPAIMLVIIGIYFAIFLTLAVRLRNIGAQFDEFRMIRSSGYAAALLYVLIVSIVASRTHIQVSGRCFCTFSVTLAVLYSFWARNGVPVYKVLFHKAEYARQFREKLRLHQESGSEVHKRDENAPIPDIPSEAQQTATDTVEASISSLLAELKVEKERVKELETLLFPVEYQQNSMPSHVSAPIILSGDVAPSFRSKSSRHRNRSVKLSKLHSAVLRATASMRWPSFSESRERGRIEAGLAFASEHPPAPLPTEDSYPEVGPET